MKNTVSHNIYYIFITQQISDVSSKNIHGNVTSIYIHNFIYKLLTDYFCAPINLQNIIWFYIQLMFPVTKLP